MGPVATPPQLAWTLPIAAANTTDMKVVCIVVFLSENRFRDASGAVVGPFMNGPHRSAAIHQGLPREGERAREFPCAAGSAFDPTASVAEAIVPARVLKRAGGAPPAVIEFPEVDAIPRFGGRRGTRLIAKGLRRG